MPTDSIPRRRFTTPVDLFRARQASEANIQALRATLQCAMTEEAALDAEIFALLADYPWGITYFDVCYQRGHKEGTIVCLPASAEAVEVEWPEPGTVEDAEFHRGKEPMKDDDAAVRAVVEAFRPMTEMGNGIARTIARNDGF